MVGGFGTHMEGGKKWWLDYFWGGDSWMYPYQRTPMESLYKPYITWVFMGKSGKLSPRIPREGPGTGIQSTNPIQVARHCCWVGGG